MMIKLFIQIAYSAAILLFFWILAFGIKGFIAKMAQTNDLNKNQIFSLLANTAYILLLIIGSISALANLGVNVNALVASLGLSGFALSFALKDALANILAGIMLFIYRPFKLGDTIRISELEGVLSKIDLRYIHLHAPNQEILIPNASLLINHIIILRKS